MTELEKAIAMLSAASGAEPSVVAEQVKSDEAPTAAATKLFEAKFTEQRDQGDQRATKKYRTDFEKLFKDAGIPDVKYSEGAAALEAYKAKAVEEASKGITAEQALNHSAVKQKINESAATMEAQIKAAVDKVKGDFQAERDLFNRQQITAKVSEKAAAVIAELKPVFSQDTTRAATQKADLLARIASGQFVEVNGELFPADPASPGEVLKDGLGNAVKLTDLVRKTTESFYDLPISEPKDSPNVRQGDVHTGGFQFKEYKGVAPKTEAEALDLRNNPDLSVAAKKEVQTYWDTQGQKP